MDMPVVAFVTPGTFDIPSATSSSVELVVEHVVPYLMREAMPIVFGRKSGRRPGFEVRGGVRYVRLAAPSPLRYIRNVSRKLKEHEHSLSWIQVENRPRFVRYLRKRHPGLKIGLFLHSLTFISRPHIQVAELKACLAAADRIIVNSHFLKERVIRKVPQVKAKVSVNHLGVDQHRFISRWSEEGAAQRREAIAHRGYEGKKIIMYVGRLIPIKGVHHLIQAMPRIVAQVPEAMLIVVGSAFYGSKRMTPYVRRLRRSSRRVRRHIRFIPYIPHSSIPEWFRLADVLVVPSPSNEAFGLVNVEAMASGVPVIASRSGGMKEIIEHGVTGLLIAPSELRRDLAAQIIALLNDDEIRERMGEAGSQRVEEHFTWSNTAERLLQLYKTDMKI
ncbi:glycosyltransferase family 4 protein [Paenibacillus piri]|uniref:Glycosyltransferase family 1 protein n=1 Tax=Paenibacillus piri TaxID=2547395 RepID=A0A4R5KRB9_9BACL|nr:glycosyltransferase family 4 protein [Paenibacillus piri]TDF97548.1 glycosyltransferase family 1 protein [Paenibacillus piri]